MNQGTAPPVHLFWPTTPQTPGYRLHADDRELFDSYFNLLHRLRLFGTRQQRRSRKSHPSCLALLDPFPVCCIDQIDLFIPYFFQLFNEGLHVSIFCLREDVMNGKCPAFFQGTQCLQQDRLTVFGRNVVVDVIAGNCVKGLIREIQMGGVSLTEADILYAFCSGIILAEGLVEGSVFFAPAVDAGPSGIRSFAAGTMARAPAVPPINEATIPFGIQFL